MSQNTLKDFKLADEEWLGLGDTSKLQLSNPLVQKTATEIQRPDLHILSLMRNPEYFGFTAKHLLNIDLLPMQVAILQELYTRPFPMLICSRGFGKSYSLAILALLKMALVPGSKIVIVGAGFRQSRVIFEYMESIWYNAPILRSIATVGMNGPHRDIDRYIFRLNGSWTIAIPLGDGNKVRGLRAHTVIADEFSSIPIDIYETVIGGFGAVTANPDVNVKKAARRRKLIELGRWTQDMEETYSGRTVNQSIIAGTADYDFGHFANYWKRYHTILESNGNKEKLKSQLGEKYDDFIDNKDYSIIRIPYELIPEGFMDDKNIARAKSTIHSYIYLKEYSACFIKDSQGFFKRSLIESCVARDTKPIKLASGNEVYFNATLHGNAKLKYVFGIDPAAEDDNFSIVILEMRGDHNRLVHCWTTNKENFNKRLKAGLVSENDYYNFCTRKIRDLMKVFPCARIGMDAQGGGIAIEGALADISKLRHNEQPIYQIIEEGVDKVTDDLAGQHILEMVQFADSTWTSQANHGLRQDMESKILLFPQYDAVTLAIATECDKQTELVDSLESCMDEIEELKDELSTIVMTRTGTSGRERWDTPEIKESGSKKGRLRKDRYSALVIANMMAKQVQNEISPMSGDMLFSEFNKIKPKMYSGPNWFIVDAEKVCRSVN